MTLSLPANHGAVMFLLQTRFSSLESLIGSTFLTNGVVVNKNWTKHVPDQLKKEDSTRHQGTDQLTRWIHEGPRPSFAEGIP